MKCLSLWQPWSSLLAHGAKRCETRSWAMSHRGPLLIHSAKKWNAELALTCVLPKFQAALVAAGVELEATEAAARRGWNLPFGAIIGRVDVVECYSTALVRVVESGPTGRAESGLLIGPTEHAFGDYSPGRFVFMCANPVAFAKPIPFRGAQGLFEVPDSLLPKDA